jgi:hypothetical protein
MKKAHSIGNKTTNLYKEMANDSLQPDATINTDLTESACK